MKDRLLIMHEVQRVKDDFILVKAAHPKVVDISLHYMDGRVRTKSGDVWSIRKAQHFDYEYITTGVL